MSVTISISTKARIATLAIEIIAVDCGPLHSFARSLTWSALFRDPGVYDSEHAIGITTARLLLTQPANHGY